MIRGKNVNQALAILQFTNKRAADGIEKCVRSAIANASEAAEKANVAIDPDELWVKACFVDRGPTKNRRRTRPAPQGRAYRERRHFCNVTILLSNDEKITAADAKKGGKAAEAKPAKLEESKTRKRGGAVAAPRAKRTAPKAESAAETKDDSKKSEGAAEETATTEE
jgi:large subunit ribosomal protein L22